MEPFFHYAALCVLKGPGIGRDSTTIPQTGLSSIPPLTSGRILISYDPGLISLTPGLMPGLPLARVLLGLFQQRPLLIIPRMPLRKFPSIPPLAPFLLLLHSGVSDSVLKFTTEKNKKICFQPFTLPSALILSDTGVGKGWS